MHYYSNMRSDFCSIENGSAIGHPTASERVIECESEIATILIRKYRRTIVIQDPAAARAANFQSAKKS
jgi:hypothetical protein